MVVFQQHGALKQFDICVMIFTAQDKPDGWGSVNYLSVDNIRETTSSGLDPSIRTFTYSIPENSTATQPMYEFILVYGFDDQGNFYYHDLTNPLGCDQHADFITEDRGETTGTNRLGGLYRTLMLSNNRTVARADAYKCSRFRSPR